MDALSEKNVKEKSELSCAFCEQQFTRTSNLRRHIVLVHSDKQQQFTCSVCDQTFTTYKTLYSHMRQIHDQKSALMDENVKTHFCQVCKKTYSSSFNFHRHLREQHDVRPVVKSSVPQSLCPLCETSYRSAPELHDHITSFHGVQLVTETKSFISEEDFKAWKDVIEKEELAFFVKFRTKRNRTDYCCHRSGGSRGRGNVKRLKWKSSQKTGRRCPAQIVTTTTEGGQINAVFTKTHVGHSSSVRHLRLTKEERDMLAGRIESGVTFERILDDIRESVSSELNRIHFIEKRDLYNIVRDYDLERDSTHKDDAFSTDMWIQEQENLGEDSPVLFCKRQGCHKEGSSLEKDDFMIVIMTQFQQQVLTRFTSDKICVDSTHNMTGYDFQLTTMLAVDEFGAGCPVAFCLSNRVDAVAMSEFFAAVKGKVGNISTKIFMSDDAPAYINAWTSVFSTPEFHLLCTWHVDKSWKKNLNKVKSKLKQSEMYKACRTLMEETDTQKFLDHLEAFEIMCESDPDTKDFGVYFQQYYANRPEQWAFCFRKGLGLNTNMYLEAVHKKLKYCYMCGKQNRRVDKCISVLMRFSRDMMFDRMIRMMKNKPTFRMEAIAQSHHKSNYISEDMIRKVHESVWVVKSLSVEKLSYEVSLNTSSICEGCPLACPECKVCVHEFSCTCVDSTIRGNLCKHVHACVRNENASRKTELIKKEEHITLTFEEQGVAVAQASQGQSVHTAKSVKEITRLKVLLDAIFGMSTTLPDQAVSEICRKADSLYQFSKSLQPKATELTAIPHLPKTPDMPSHKNVEQQRRFYTTKKKLQGLNINGQNQRTCKRILSKQLCRV